MRRVLGFGLAGVIGLAADAGMLALLLAATPLGPFVARVGSIVFAIVVTWLFNRTITFGPSSRHVSAEGARYGGVALSVSVANYFLYSGLLMAIPGLNPLLAMAAASAAAMLLSWLGYSRLVFDR